MQFTLPWISHVELLFTTELTTSLFRTQGRLYSKAEQQIMSMQ